MLLLIGEQKQNLYGPGHPLVAAADATHNLVLARSHERLAEAVAHPELLVLAHEHHKTVA